MWLVLHRLCRTCWAGREIGCCCTAVASGGRWFWWPMREHPSDKVEAGRLDGPRGKCRGTFVVIGPHGRDLRMICDDGRNLADAVEHRGWEHVSVSLATRAPNWAEMCFVKDAFWREDETVVQFHPRQAKYVN